MKKLNIIPAVLHLKEASDLLLYIDKNLSNLLLQLSNELLQQFKISDDEIQQANNIVNSIEMDDNENG